MKNLKKYIAFLLTAIMMLSMAVTAFAADATGSITVNGTTNEKEYEIYKIFDMTTANDTYTSVAYTIDSDWTAFFNGDGNGYLTDTNSGNLNPITVDGATKYINITEDNIAAFAAAALDYAIDNNITVDNSSTATADSLKFDNLALGYYLVYPKGATSVKSDYASVCSLTSTNPDATVNVKADYPTIEKVVDDENPEIGQTVTYTITGQVPDTTGYESYEYTVKDTMSDGLTFNADVASMEVKFGDTAITDITPTIENNGFTLTFDMTEYQDYKNQAITITYKAVVNESAVNGADGNANEATLTYSNDPTDSTKKDTTPPEEVKVYVAGIQIDKYDKNNEETKLADAKFVLKNTEGKFYKLVDNKVSWVDSEVDATVVTTDNNGTAYFKGLENGTYSLKETEAPKGYNLLTEEVSVTVDYTNQTATVYATANVPNSTGTLLPTTGGMGTTIFYIVGAILVLGSAVLLVIKKRENNTK